MGDHEEPKDNYTEELATKSMRVESKIIYFSLRENSRGRYLKISEVGRTTKSTMILPMAGWEQFDTILKSFIENSDDMVAEAKAKGPNKANRIEMQPSRRPRDPATIICKRCREAGHRVAECTKAKTCYRCNSTDHLGKECTEPERCHECGQEGHIKRECPAAIALQG
eukprot:GFYU01001071.1.p1 GENE.GFYU01001071.1~~GFYU01001071.1.p1  ORF type:complete len:168 (+),score=45.54 GFYU01001071.1:104-607(+)